MKQGYKLLFSLIIIIIISLVIVGIYSVNASTTNHLRFPIINGYLRSYLLYCPYNYLKIDINESTSNGVIIEIHVISKISSYSQNLTEPKSIIFRTGTGPVYILIIVHAHGLTGGQGWMKLACRSW